MKRHRLVRWFGFGASILAALTIWAARPLPAAAACTPTAPCYTLSWFSKPIAPDGSLASGAKTTFQLAAQKNNGTEILDCTNCTVALRIDPASTAPGSATAITAGMNGVVEPGTPTVLTTTYQNLSTSDNLGGVNYVPGEIDLTFTSSTPRMASGTFTVNADLLPTGCSNLPCARSSDSYTYNTAVGKLAFSPTPIAPTGSLGANQSAGVSVMTQDSGGNAVGAASVWLSFNQGVSGSGANAGGTALTASPSGFTSDNSGNVAIHYSTPVAAVPGSGTDTITAQSAASGGVVASDSYTYSAAVQKLIFAPSPIAGNGTLGAGQSRSVTVTAQANNGTPISAVSVWLSFSPAAGGGTATVGSATLTSTPAAFTTDSAGHVTITYRTPPANLPASGTDTITAQDSSGNPAVGTTDTYTYATQFVFSPNPIANDGALGANTAVTITLTTQQSGGAAVGSAQVWLSFTQASGGGSATAGPGGPALTATPASFTSDASGHVTITYRTPTSLPAGGTDRITAQNAASNPSLLAPDSYTFKVIARNFAFSPRPIANKGSLDANQSVTVTLTTQDSSLNPVPGASTWLSLSQATGGGSAMVGSTPMTANPKEFVSDGAAHITITYTAPGVLPNGGTDKIIAQDLSSSPSVVVEDAYSYLPMVAALPAVSNQAYGGFTTVTYVQNTGTLSATVVIRYFDAGGNRVGHDDVNTALPANGNWTVRQDNGNGLPGQTAGSALVFSDQPVAAFVNEFAPHNAGDATSYSAIQLPSGAASTLSAPAIASNAYGGYTTAIGLINLASTATDITITYRKGDGTVQATQTLTGVAPGAYRGVYSGDSGSATDAKLPANFSGTATIQSSAGMVAAIVNEVGPGGQFSSYDTVATGARTLYAPTTLNDAYGGYNTAIGLQNLSSSGANVTIGYSGQVGSGTTTQSFVEHLTLAPFGYAGDYNGGGSTNPVLPDGFHGSGTISSDQPLAAIVNEVAAPATAGGPITQSTAYNTFAAGVSAAHLALVANAGSDGVTTGVGIENVSGSPASVTIAYYDAGTGTLLTQKTVSIPAGSFIGAFTPADLPTAGTRATAVVSTSGNALAVIVNEVGTGMFMSYDAQ
jgi:hypothetical protein